MPAAALVFAALCINLSWVHAHHDGDSVLLPLISTLRWTPFYWADNRYGMPVPALASWIADPAWNLLFQTQIFALAAVSLVVLGNLFFFHRKDTPLHVRLATSCIALVICLLVLQPTRRTARIFVLADPYVISLLPMLAAVAIVLRTSRASDIARVAFAAPLVFLSVWINYSHVLIAGVMALMLPHSAKSWRETARLRGLFVSVVALCFFGVRAWASRYSAYGEPKLDLANWVPTMRALSSSVSAELVHATVLLVLLLGAALAASALPQTFRFKDAVVFCLASVLFAAAVATSDWPRQNGYEPRYWTTPLTLLLLSASAMAGRGLFALLERLGSRRAQIVAALLPVIVALAVFGVPNPFKARALLLATTGKTGVHAVTLGCTHMIGDYNPAWMNMFYARAVGRDAWAATPRAEVTRDLWDRMPPKERKFCATVNQRSTLQSLATFQLGVPSWSGFSGGIIRYELPR